MREGNRRSNKQVKQIKHREAYHIFRYCIRVRTQVNYFKSSIDAFDNPLQKVSKADLNGHAFCRNKKNILLENVQITSH